MDPEAGTAKLSLIHFSTNVSIFLQDFYNVECRGDIDKKILNIE